MLICPVCSLPLSQSGSSLRCQSGHSFDLAASGYCNLLTGSKDGKYIGDNKDMVAARRRFLESDTYAPLRDALAGQVCEYARAGFGGLAGLNVLDAGCGEGYYTRAVAAALEGSGRLGQMIGVDISKSATQYAAKRDKLTRYITASSYHLPVADCCADLILSLFAPAPAEEFRRVLRPEGRVIQVAPGSEHLWELKEAVYDRAYPNREDKHTLEGFRLTDRRKLTFPCRLESKDLIQALFAMTPYAHRTPKEGLERLSGLSSLTTTLSFVILTFAPERE